MGYAANARQHADCTHRLPLPPNAMGESNFPKIYQDIVGFITPENGFNDRGNENSLVVFARRNHFPMLDSFLKQFSNHAPPVKIEVFSLEDLFFFLKEKSVATSPVVISVPIASVHVSNILLDRDTHSTTEGLACRVRSTQPCLLISYDKFI